MVASDEREPTRPRHTQRGTTGERGYGPDHRRLRKALLANAIGKPCPRCGEPIQPGDKVDLDHTDQRDGYLGIAHATCNRRAAARKGNRTRRVGTNSRDW